LEKLKYGSYYSRYSNNLGDYIQLIATEKFLPRVDYRVDRDTEMDSISEKTFMILNGWFKHFNSNWPPSDFLHPLIYGFHTQLGYEDLIENSNRKILFSEEAISFYKNNTPIGCRDKHTEKLMKSFEIESYTSRCLSLTFDDVNIKNNKKIIVSSKDSKILNYIPKSIQQNCVYINHYLEKDGYSYSEDYKFKKAFELLDYYKNNAKLVVTTFLHSAAPCIAMGIPTILFCPFDNNLNIKKTDINRLSCLDGVIDINNINDLSNINWNPEKIDNSFKYKIIEDVSNNVNSKIESIS